MQHVTNVGLEGMRVFRRLSAGPQETEASVASCPIGDTYVPPAPPEVTLTDADQLRLREALDRLSDASGRVYYDPRADATERSAYYGSLEREAQWLSPVDFYDRLSALLAKTHTSPLDYSPSTELYPWIDLHPDGKLYSIYSGREMDPAAMISDDVLREVAERDALVTASMGGGPAGIATANATLSLNCEHVVPQSWFNKQSPMRGDLHHLFACDPGCNSMRGSVPYADEEGDPGGSCGRVSSRKDSFEPAGGRGAVARATLYFIMRYPGVVGDEKGEYTMHDLKTLVAWSKQFPPSEYELHRNAEIARRQGNRNPLVDHPEWVDKIAFERGLGRAG